MTKIKIFWTFVILQIFSVSSQTFLRADGKTDTYSLIHSVLGRNTVEVPDCKHNVTHISQTLDNELNRQVFVFSLHVDQDKDRCGDLHKDRQRNEIKVDHSSPNDLKGFYNETVSLSWNFKLDSGLQTSHALTHVHQLKIKGGSDFSDPIITLTPIIGSPDELHIIHIGPNKESTVIGTTPLTPFRGTWVHVKEDITYSTTGQYKLTITRVSDGATMYSLNKSNLNLWRSGGRFVTPKWGFYRSLNDKSNLKDDSVRFDTFCIAKGSSHCN